MTNKPKKTKASKILDKENPILREVAQEVPLKDIKGVKIQKILKEMKAALKGEEDGVAIAAPQIGHNLRIFVVSGAVITPEGEPKHEDLVFINPEIKKVSKKKILMEEGCLSVRWLYGEVSRHEKATVSAYDGNGKKFTVGASGLLAQIFQHETDHLNGVLFIDKAKNIRDLPPNTSNNNGK